MSGHWEQGWATWEDCRDSLHHCREKISVTKAQLEFKLATTVKETKRPFKIVNSKRRIKDNIGQLREEVSHPKTRDTDKMEV